MPRAAIITALRTPVGKYGGALKSVRPDDLAAHAIKSVVERSGIDPAFIDDVYLGAANKPAKTTATSREWRRFWPDCRILSPAQP
jgi:acetyl-CoA acetyltransferase